MKTSMDIGRKTASEPAGKPRQTVLFYSPDVDFCVSMRLLFQDRYQVVTVSDPDMVLPIAREFRPYLMIVDSAPTRIMRQRFEAIKKENPRTHIMSFYAPQFLAASDARESLRSVDAAYSKPIDLEEVTKSMSEMMAEGD
jgi:hypothetical protein